METLYDNTKKSKLTNSTKENEINYYYEPAIKTSRTTTRNENYYQLDYANELTKLNAEKQQLISFLEDKIKKSKKKIKENLDRTDYLECLNKKIAYQEVLDFVNKGGKDE